MKNLPHRIRRQRWVIQTGTPAEAFAWRAFLRDKGQNLLFPVLESAFDDAVGVEVVSLPRIDLTVRIRSDLRSPEELSPLLLEQIKEQLRERMLPGSGQEAQSKKHGPSKAPARSLEHFGLLLDYLRTGTVEWYAASAQAPETERFLIETCKKEWKQILGYVCFRPESVPFYFRLLQLLSGESTSLLLSELLETVLGRHKVPAVMWVKAVLGPPTGSFSRYARLRTAAAVLSESLKAGEDCAVTRLLSAAVESCPIDERTGLYRSISFLGDAGKGAVHFLRDVYGVNEIHGAPGELERSPEISIREGSAAGTIDKSINNDLIHDDAEEEPFGLLVHQAGLILLHPYLPRFFENTGIVEKRSREIPPGRRARAAALLHLLATGREKIYEYELGVIKVLLGLHPLTPLPVDEGLAATNDASEAAALLQSAIDHWSAIKKTSIQGFRSSFLERSALLREEAHGWRMQVERKSFDMLLDQLPWSINAVKLPWMRRPISVEW